ncbi:MFS transporter [Micromonospora sp. NPDC007271]|uniref:MFS transporter n=1 Tax=Micromonospora sp. NPDC007271 TaxID=3154587 RepID=UPI00340A4CEA
MLSPLRSANFRWMLTARTLSITGNTIAPLAMAFAVLDAGWGVGGLSLVVGARSLVNVLMLLGGGVLADRLPRSVVLQGTSVVAATAQAAIAVLILTDRALLPVVVALAMVNGVAAGLALPASSALIPQTVPPDRLRPANALLRIMVNAATIGGAAVGGILVAAVGPGWGLAIDGGCFLLAGLCFALIRVEAAAAGGPSPRPLRALLDGWQEFTRRTWIWVLSLQMLLVNMCFAAGMLVLGPTVADGTVGRASWGLIFAAQTGGMVAGGLLAANVKPRHPLRWPALLLVAQALPMLALALRPSLVVLVVAMVLSGLAMEQFGVAWDVAVQNQVPDDRLARVYSWDAFASLAAVPVGQLAAAPVAAGIGVTRSLLLFAGVVVVACLILGTVRDVRRLQLAPAVKEEVVVS